MFFLPQVHRHAAFREGMRATAPVALGIAAWGLMTGVAMVRSGMSVVEAVAMTSRISHTSFDAINAYAQSLFWSQVLDFVEDPDDPNEPEHEECPGSGMAARAADDASAMVASATTSGVTRRGMAGSSGLRGLATLSEAGGRRARNFKGGSGTRPRY